MHHKHDAFGVSLHNSCSITAKLNRETKGPSSAICDDEDSIGQGMMVHEENVIMIRESPY